MHINNKRSTDFFVLLFKSEDKVTNAEEHLIHH